MKWITRLIQAAGEELILDIRRGEFRTCLDEETDRARAGHQRPTPREDILHPRLRLQKQAVVDVVVGVAIARLVNDTAADVVLQVLTDAGQLVNDRDAESLEQLA